MSSGSKGTTWCPHCLRKTHSYAIIVNFQNIKDKEKFLKVPWKKTQAIYLAVTLRLSLEFTLQQHWLLKNIRKFANLIDEKWHQFYFMIEVEHLIEEPFIFLFLVTFVL